MDKDKPNKDSKQIDLNQFRQLIGDAKGEDYSLEEILAEYSTGKPRKRRTGGSSDAFRKQETGRLVLFPGTGPLPELQPKRKAERSPVRPLQTAPPPEPEEPPAPPAGDGAEEPPAEEKPPSRVEPGAVSKLIRQVNRKADDYADRMFEEDENIDPEEVRRLERLIPGTDREEEPEEPPPRFRWERKPEPPPPDTSPRELARTWGRGLKFLRVRAVLVFLLAAAAAVQLLCPALGFLWLPPLDDPVLQAWISVGLLGAGALLGCDALLEGLLRAFRLKIGMDTLTLISCLLTLGDGVWLALSPAPGRYPYSAACLAAVFFLLHGRYHKRCGLRLSCRTAAASASPYRVTLDEKKWNARDTYCKWSGDAESFGSQIQADDGAQRFYRRVCPLLLIACLALGSLAHQGHEEESGHLLWTLSALFTASAALGSGLVYGRSFHRAARRLARTGGALAGWPGIAGSRRDSRVLITDADLFPPGYVELQESYRISREFPPERVLSYTATLIRDAGSGASKPFLDELRRIGGLPRRAEDLVFHEGGGVSATIRHERVLVGTASFMKLMEVPVTQGLNVRGAVFCAIDGRLAGIFALNYILPDTVFPALEMLMGEKVGPVLATRDFNLIPAMLRQRFKLAADKMDFPPVERRRELSDPDQPHSGALTALLCREGLLPFAEAVTAARRLRRATLLGAGFCCAGSALGLAICTYLASVSAYTSLSPLNLLIFLLMWLLPVWLLTDWVDRF